MLDFYRKNKDVIIKMLLYQFGSAVLGIIVTSAAIKSDKMLLFAAIFSTLFYLFIIYNAMWDEGGRERIKVDGGRAEMKPLRGLFISLWANVPNIILAVLIVVGYIFGLKEGPFAYEWGGSIYAVASFTARFWEAMYLGFIALFSPRNPIGFVLIILPAPAVSTVAYIRGLYNKKLFKSKK